MTEIKTAAEAIEEYKTFDGWRYADREAAWKWMFERGMEAQREIDAQICEEMIDTTTRGQYATQAECKTVLNTFIKCAAAIREQT